MFRPDALVILEVTYLKAFLVLILRDEQVTYYSYTVPLHLIKECVWSVDWKCKMYYIIIMSLNSVSQYGASFK